jgi:NADH:ubiquinone reductase (H+-translocating)
VVVELGLHKAVANPLNIQLSGYPAKLVTRGYHLYAIPRGVNRWAVTLAYLTDMLFTRTVVSLGLSTQSDAEFSTSEGIPLPKADYSV